MNKPKNIILLIGLISGYIVFLWNFLYFVSRDFNILSPVSSTYLLYNNILPFVFTSLLLILPTVILWRNLKRKKSKILSAVSAVAFAIFLIFEIFTLLTPAIPQYLLISKLGLIDTYFTIFLNYLSSGGALTLLSYLFLFIGSLLSLLKNK